MIKLLNLFSPLGPAEISVFSVLIFGDGSDHSAGHGSFYYIDVIRSKTFLQEKRFDATTEKRFWKANSPQNKERKKNYSTNEDVKS